MILKWLFGCWTEERHPGVMGCHEKRIRVRVCGLVFTIAQWET